MPDYTALDDSAARNIAIIVANKCRAVGRPVSLADLNFKRSKTDYTLLTRAVKLGYLTSWPLRAVTLYMPHDWGFGPPRKGCCT